ncbi:MAG: hypothetical protein AAFX40_09545, partial [Cyanobacteria bacterium J06639_1]
MATLTWIGGTGNWNVLTNWLNGIAPDSTTGADDVDISVGGGITTSHTTGNTVINNLNSTDAFTLSGGTLTANLVDVDNTFTLAGGVLIGATVDTAGGDVNFTNNSNNILDNVTFNGDINLDQSGSLVRLRNGTTFTGNVNASSNSARLWLEDAQTLDNTTINLTGSSSGIGLSGQGTYAVIFGANLQINLDGASSFIRDDQFFNQTGSVVNQGTITADGTVSLTSDRDINVDSFTNTGAIVAVSGVEFNLGGTGVGETFLNDTTGTITASGGSRIRLRGDWDNNGTITLQDTSILELEGSGNSTADLGTINQSNDSTVFIETVLDNTGDTLTLDANAGSYTLNGGTILGGTVDQSGGNFLN